MRASFQTYSVLVLLIAPVIARAQTANDTANVEIAAAQSLVTKYKPSAVQVDADLFVKSGDAIIATKSVRSAERQQLLQSALRGQIHSVGRVPVTVRTTDPAITGNEARVIVELSAMYPGRPKEEWETYATGPIESRETVEVVLDRRGEEWVVRERRYLRGSR